MHSPYPSGADIQCRCANAGFGAQKRKCLRKFFVECLRGKRAILVPPQCSAINVCLRSLCEPNFHGLSAATMGEPCKRLFSGNRLSALGLGDRKKQFGLLLKGQSEAAFIIFGQNSHRRALFECHALDYDFTSDNLSSSYLHRAKNTPIHDPSWTEAERFGLRRTGADICTSAVLIARAQHPELEATGSKVIGDLVLGDYDFAS